MGIETKPWNAAEHLDSDEAVLAYLEAIFEDGDPELIAAVDAVVAPQIHHRARTRTVAVDAVPRDQMIVDIGPETLRERVQASVVLAQRIELGPRRTAKVALRQDLATGDLVERNGPEITTVISGTIPRCCRTSAGSRH